MWNAPPGIYFGLANLLRNASQGFAMRGSSSAGHCNGQVACGWVGGEATDLPCPVAFFWTARDKTFPFKSHLEGKLWVVL